MPRDWKRDLLKVVRDALVKREHKAGEWWKDLDWWDPAAKEELFEETLLALYPPDGRDGRKQ